ncbi:50S ribosomal protein L16 [Candidatus Nanohalococcus occultus]|uniref:Ribosomal protein L10AE/L16 n=1 Tax=Candidatus Nanohalococcus occultus TaxID=2978047 RepID=A0ABY8CEG2_9ARCH|nr:Ribosomal protein L10AE/L16 [Candidatus Nanohaloarchaeota archaeon SVXNc]
MGDRPASIYREHPGQPYTRQSQKKNDNYIKGAPAPRVTQYVQGAKKGDHEFDSAVILTLDEDCTVRSEALESGRIAANSHLSKVLDPEEDYILRIKPYPHHVLRYHPLAGIAQADRYYEGMRKPFGRPIGRAAIVDEGQIVFKVEVDEGDLPEAKKALERASHKMPVPTRVKLEK